MSSMILLFSLLTPNLGDFASELVAAEPAEPRSDAIARMLSQFDAEYEVELALENVQSIF